MPRNKLTSVLDFVSKVNKHTSFEMMTHGNLSVETGMNKCIFEIQLKSTGENSSHFSHFQAMITLFLLLQIFT